MSMPTVNWKTFSRTDWYIVSKDILPFHEQKSRLSVGKLPIKSPILIHLMHRLFHHFPVHHNDLEANEIATWMERDDVVNGLSYGLLDSLASLSRQHEL